MANQMEGSALLGNWLQKHVLIEYSPFLEMVVSLHVLQDPEHHLGRLNWARETEALLSPALKRQLVELGQISNDWLNLYDLHDLGGFQESSVEEGIEKLLAVEERQFVYCLLGQAMPLDQVDLWLQGKEVDKEQWRKERPLLLKPATWRR